jgi:UPF0716 protein FxsA
MAGLLVVALLVVPLVEIFVLLQVGQVLGAVPTLGLLLAMSLVGAYLLRREGTRTWRAFRSALQSGRVPAQEVADGALVILGGSLLLTPGFVTDAVGLACVLPPSRAVLRRVALGLVTRRLGVAGFVGGVAAEHLGRRRAGRGSGSHPGVVEGQVVDPPSPPEDGGQDDRRTEGG